MKELRKISVLILIFTCVFNWVKADIGLTYQLKQQRSEVLSEINNLRSDSIDNSVAIDSLQNVVIDLDAEIMASYDETVSRLAARNRDFGADSKSIVFIALITTGLALFLFLLLITARRRILASENVGLRSTFKQLTSELVGSVSHENVNSKSLLRVNVVVVLGLIIMSVSVLAFLLRTL